VSLRGLDTGAFGDSAFCVRLDQCRPPITGAGHPRFQQEKSCSNSVFYFYYLASFTLGGQWAHRYQPGKPSGPSWRLASDDLGRIEGVGPVVEVSWGNALDEGSRSGRRGWFVGHFVAPSTSPAATEMVEVKWGVHAAGEIKAIEGVNRSATTMSLLVSGRFHLDFPSHGRSVTLVRAGDYAIWSLGVSHRWRVLEDAVVITIRWPSRPDDQSGHPAPPRQNVSRRVRCRICLAGGTPW
jgi:hypothetical protein